MAICLPFEILIAIVKEVDDVRDLFHLRLAGHVLCAASTPFAFSTLSAITTRTSAQNLGRLFDLPDIAVHVREVSYHDAAADRKGRELKNVRTEVIHELASLFSRLYQLPRLESVNLTFYPCYDNRRVESDGLTLQASVLGALAASFRIHVPPRLASLSLHNLRVWNLSPFDSRRFRVFLTTLRHFQLSVLFDSVPDPETFSSRWCHFWHTLFPRILAPTQQTLTELTLHSDELLGASSGLSLSALHFPHLCTLSMRKFVFEQAIGVVPFILRHTPTLTRLELLACKMPIPLDAHLLPWIPPPPSSTALSPNGSSCWYQIWDLFAAELISLISLHVVDDPGCSYISSGTGLSWLSSWTSETLEPRDAADAASLELFQTVVASRSETRKES
ncbi:hypothetical protein EI94DRAFT_1705012 [Lactarius quietus]|nr:hypothetical protein EI94DRAFT_1705012 [Lactarius quietus]